jgi:hypothetical protein
LGEECIAGAQPVRMATAVSLGEGVMLQIERQEMVRALHKHHALSDIFGGDGGLNPFANKFLYEQLLQTGIYRI